MKSKILNQIVSFLKQKKCIFLNILIIFFIFFIKKNNFSFIKLKNLEIFSFFLLLIIILLVIKKYYNHINSIYKDMKIEIKKITWPNKKETLYTTFIIILISFFISIILWSLDNIIFYLISFITSLKY
ncbi:preprotein translocase subunit SecE [Buchnera aphidicola (Periphyllus koelreuteriae)]|uniref:preprotein translocase subunit SecE n=1 Tax=Buchnera aphidicola TaxID=9 RepID=UPI0031B870A5